MCRTICPAAAGASIRASSSSPPSCRMNMERHVKAHRDLYEHLSAGREAEKAKVIKAFYDEYFAVLDLPAEFYLETVKTVFQDACAGARQARPTAGQTVDPRAIRRTTLLTVEGERDDICSSRPDGGGARLCDGATAVSEAPSHAGRRRPLRHVQRSALERSDLSRDPQSGAGDELIGLNRSTREVELKEVSND